MNLKDLFGEKWAKVLEGYVSEELLYKISGLIKLDRNRGYNVLPPEGSDLFFRVFNLVDPDYVKLIWIGQDPYPQDKPLIMTGIAFDCSNTITIQPSLANIIKEIQREYPDKFNIDGGDLMYLVKQGVFLINSALSVIENKPGSHTKIWEPFTIAWIKALQQLNDKVWLLCGRDSQQYKHLIINPSHAIIETSHPSPLGATKAAPIPFLGSNCFRQINEELEARNRNLINW